MPCAWKCWNAFAACWAVRPRTSRTLGAFGGIFIGGGIVPRMAEWFKTSPFRTRFEAKGRFGSYLARIPTWVITAGPSAALRGASQALDDRLDLSVR